MKIDVSKMRCSWWEDGKGNVLELGKYEVPSDEEKEKYPYYHDEFPCRLQHNVSRYGYHPTGINKLLIKLPFIGNYVKKKIGKSFMDICTIGLTFYAGSDCIVAMVNSGDYTLEQAIWIWANACERCMNVLCYKYLDGKDGYAEHSDEWVKCGTVCDFCEGEQ